MSPGKNSEQTETTDNNLYYVAQTSEIQEGERIIVEVQGREIAVFNVDGEFYALSNYCIHQGGPACEGLISGSLSVDDEMELTYERDGEVVSCPWHGWEFDIKSGDHLAPTNYKLPTYNVLEQDEGIYLKE